MLETKFKHGQLVLFKGEPWTIVKVQEKRRFSTMYRLEQEAFGHRRVAIAVEEQLTEINY